MRLTDAALRFLAERLSAAELAELLILDRAERARLRAVARAQRLGLVLPVDAAPNRTNESASKVAVGLQLDSPKLAERSAAGLDHPRVKLALARKALPLAGLGQNAQQVAAALLEFCNIDTLRCSPGLDAIVLKLGRGSQKDPRRHVRRGITQLVTAGVLRVAVHGGLGHANAYFFQWERLAAIVAAFEAGDGVVVRLAGDGQSDSPDKSVLQNQKKILPSVRGERSQRAREPDHRQRILPLPVVVAGSTAPNRTAIAHDEAKRRLAGDVALHASKLGANGGRRWMATIPQEAWEVGRAAELNARGSGLRMLLDRAFEMETGPPKATVAGR